MHYMRRISKQASAALRQRCADLPFLASKAFGQGRANRRLEIARSGQCRDEVTFSIHVMSR